MKSAQNCNKKKALFGIKMSLIPQLATVVQYYWIIGL